MFKTMCLIIHRIHKWRTRGKKLVPSHESEVLEDKQKLQMKTFSDLAECLARILPNITLYGRLFKCNYVGCLQLLMFSTDLLFAFKRDAYIFNETGWFCRFPKHQKLDKWAIAAEKQQTRWPKLHTETKFEASPLQFCKTEIKTDIGGEKKRNKWRVYGLLVNERDVRQMLHKTGQVESGWKIHSRHSFIHVSVILYISMYINTCILGRTYFIERSIHLIEEHWLLIITGVQASGVIIDRLLWQCCFVWSKIVGPHLSGNFNDWPLKLKAGSKIWVDVIGMH